MSIPGALRGMIVRAIARITNDFTTLQQAQLEGLEGQTRTDVEVFHPYGFSAYALPGGVTVLVHANGDQSDPIALPPSHRAYRRKGLLPGQTVVYTADKTEILLDNAGSIIAKAATQIFFDTPVLRVTGEIIDRCDSGGSTMSQMRASYDNHDHDENDSGGPTDKPNQTMGGH